MINKDKLTLLMILVAMLMFTCNASSTTKDLNDEMIVVFNKLFENNLSLKNLNVNYSYNHHFKNDTDIITCASDYKDIDLIIIQELRKNKCSRHFEYNSIRIKIEDVVILNSIEGYPFPITGLLDCDLIKTSEIIYNSKKYLLIESNPMDWTGKMNRFAFYQLIDLQTGVGIQTIAPDL